ncbi:hypothetical protein [Bradyrhizobium guangzhouense]|uniref:Uncharacterized protein n=1 Tax=Bradyrhizobium guangzhouense TaxID=1325095 RepID=A0AAE5X7F1_9BRAD|nr:hypothetical protein [Bradyrhizobium guangzhouense]QAU50242.1 hypothetical protein XH91_19620 [Bradyrhizobium guangzhouense]RXH08286.1 hypothetical protein EAS56_29810 [Bradyrhizobium guangzhouense]RXH14876.1 hypothetical protein EAS54_20340 [Bradyrhizobium guangzhouense]
MMFDLRVVAIAASLILASITVAAAEGEKDQPAKATTGTTATTDTTAARPIRVVLPAPWEPAPASSGERAIVQK